ncbi:MAG: ribosome biogenesis factor YjgA [bacterium]
MIDPPRTKTQKRRDAKFIEQVALELAELPSALLPRLPCEPEILDEIQKIQSMKQSGARHRQIKYLSKLLRKSELMPLLDFLDSTRKSPLKKNKTSRELERLRDRLLNEDEEELALREVESNYPKLDGNMIQDLVQKYRWTRNQKFSREILRQLKIAQTRNSSFI